MPPEDELGAAWGRVSTVSPGEANAIVIGEIFGGLNVRAMLPHLLAAYGRSAGRLATEMAALPPTDDALAVAALTDGR